MRPFRGHFLEIGQKYWLQLCAKTIFWGRLPLEMFGLIIYLYFKKIDFFPVPTCTDPTRTDIIRGLRPSVLYLIF